MGHIPISNGASVHNLLSFVPYFTNPGLKVFHWPKQYTPLERGFICLVHVRLTFGIQFGNIDAAITSRIISQAHLKKSYYNRQRKIILVSVAETNPMSNAKQYLITRHTAHRRRKMISCYKKLKIIFLQKNQAILFSSLFYVWNEKIILLLSPQPFLLTPQTFNKLLDSQLIHSNSLHSTLQLLPQFLRHNSQ